MTIVNILPKERLNVETSQLSNYYPNDSTSKNPLPIYIISSHGSIDFGIRIQKTKNGEHSIEPNSFTSDRCKGTNFFTPDNDVYVYNTAILGSDAAINYRKDNIILDVMRKSKKTRNTIPKEPNFATFARKLFSEEEVFEPIRQELVSQTYITNFNEFIDEICDQIYNNLKSYNLRRKGQKLRRNKRKFKKSYHIDRELYDKISEKDKRYLLKKYKRASILVKRSKIDSILESCHFQKYLTKCYDDICNNIIPFHKVSKQNPIVGVPNIPTIEKSLTFMDIKNKSKQQWNFGIVEISENTQEYIEKHPEIKFTEFRENIKNYSKRDKKARIFNNEHPGLLSGICAHNNISKHEWFTKRVNRIIDYPASNHITLSELTYHFGKGIYIITNCSPLRIWCSSHNTKISKRYTLHSSVFSSYHPTISGNSLFPKQFRSFYINDREVLVGDELLEERDIYRAIFESLQKYNDDIYNMWPRYIKNLENPTKFPPIRQIITPDGFVMD